MRAFLATVLSIIAVGVLLIAYGLLSPRVAANGASGLVMTDRVPTQAVYAGEYAPVDPAYQRMPGYAPVARPAYVPVSATAYRDVAPATDTWTPRRTTSRVARPRRDWMRTALVIGGSTAAGAGLGGVIGGGKGAAIGAALGGGASTLWEATRR